MKIDIEWMPKAIKELDQKLTSVGGTAYLVGGAVLDVLSNKEPKDWDIEVFGLSYDQLLEVTSCWESDLIGSKFGVVKIVINGLDIELAVPRIENNTGPKHVDFNIEFVPDLSIYEASRRRDLTINAIYLQLSNGKIHDPFGGVADYKIRMINHIDDKTFIEDPLRAFRVMQLVARKCKTVSKDTVDLCSSMKDVCSSLSGDSIFGEFVKMLMLSDRPDRGLRFLERSGLIGMFPELSDLVGCPQKREYHPEGDVWMHTLMVVREAAIYRDDLPEEWRLPFMFGMLLHDAGKPVALDPIKLTAYSHDSKGASVARTFMERITNNEKLIDKVIRIVKVHMRPRMYLKSCAKAAAWRKLHNQCPLHILAYVSMCDKDGRGINPSATREGKDSKVFQECIRMHSVIGAHKDNIPQVLLGRHLIAAGHKPGVEFSIILNKAYEYQLETGCEDIQELIDAATI